MRREYEEPIVEVIDIEDVVTLDEVEPPSGGTGGVI